MNKTGALLLVLCATGLAALYFLARPQPSSGPAPSAAPAGPPRVTVPGFEFEIAAGKARGPAVLAASRGQRVTLRVRSDGADELHVHGYDLSAPLPAGELVTLNFVADRAGRFQIELHHAGIELGALEVQP